MADNQNQQQIILSIGADTSDLRQEIQNTREELTGIGNTAVSATNIKSFKEQLREATRAALELQQAGRENTEEYRRAVTQISNLRDQQDLLNRAVRAFDPGNSVAALGQIASNGANAVAGLAGALSLFGVDAENASVVMARLQSLLLMTQAIDSVGDLGDFWKAFRLRISEATVAQEGMNVAQTTGIGLSKALKIGLASLGIGALVLVVSYLVANFDKVKQVVADLIPGLGSMGRTFDTVKSVVVGVGGAIVQFAIAPIRSLIFLLQGEFMQAVQSYVDGMNVVKNYKDSYNEQDRRNTANRNKEILEETIKNQESQLAVLNAGGKNTDKLQREIFNNKRKLYADDAEKQKEVIQESLVYEAQQRKAAADKAKQVSDKRAQEAKARADKAKGEREQNLKEISDNEIEVETRIRQFNFNSRQKDLDDLQKSFDKKINLYNKYGKDTTKVTEDFNNSRSQIEQKYDEQINDFISATGTERLSQYDKLIEETNKKYSDISKNATDNQKETLEILRTDAVSEINAIKELDASNAKSQINLTTTESQNNVVSGDSPDSAYNKTMNVLAAQRAAELDSYALELAQLGDNQLQKEKLEAEHQAKLKSIRDGELAASAERTTAQKELDKAELDSKMNQLASISNSLGAFSELAGEQTVFGKALAVSAATISTIQGAVQAFTSLSGIPIVGVPLGIAAASAAAATGAINIKKILAVKIPTKSGSGSGGGISAPSLSSAQAPNISANPQNLLPQDVRVTNSQDNVVTAVISDKELNDNSNRNDFLNNLNSL